MEEFITAAELDMPVDEYKAETDGTGKPKPESPEKSNDDLMSKDSFSEMSDFEIPMGDGEEIKKMSLSDDEDEVKVKEMSEGDAMLE